MCVFICLHACLFVDKRWRLCRSDSAQVFFYRYCCFMYILQTALNNAEVSCDYCKALKTTLEVLIFMSLIIKRNAVEFLWQGACCNIHCSYVFFRVFCQVSWCDQVTNLIPSINNLFIADVTIVAGWYQWWNVRSIRKMWIKQDYWLM